MTRHLSLLAPAAVAKVAVTLGYLLTWTNPSMNMAPDSCGSGGLPLHDLGVVEVYARPHSFGRATLYARTDQRGREGMAASYQWTTPGWWRVWVIARDTLGNMSCSSPAIEIGVPLEVPLPVAAAAIEWVDVAGRRLDQAPTQPGIYFRRRPGEHAWRVVLLR